MDEKSADAPFCFGRLLEKIVSRTKSSGLPLRFDGALPVKDYGDLPVRDSKRVAVGFASTDADCMLQRGNENLAVADLAGPSRCCDRLNATFGDF
jgi:hypothetical protein